MHKPYLTRNKTIGKIVLIKSAKVGIVIAILQLFNTLF